MLLAKTLRSSTFRQALIAIATFGLIVSAIFSYVYLSTSSYVPSRSDRATVTEYGAPQERAKGSNNLAANIFLHFKEILNDFDFATTAGTSKVVFEPLGVVGIFTP